MLPDQRPDTLRIAPEPETDPRRQLAEDIARAVTTYFMAMLPAIESLALLTTSATPAPAGLRGVEEAALEAAPARNQRPVSVKQLARLAGYRDTGHFREAVRVLIDRGLLVRVRGGIKRGAAPMVPSSDRNGDVNTID